MHRLSIDYEERGTVEVGERSNGSTGGRWDAGMISVHYVRLKEPRGRE